MKRFFLALAICFFSLNFVKVGAMTVKLNNAPLQFSISEPRVIWLLGKGEQIEVGSISNNFYPVTYNGKKGYVHKNYVTPFSLEEYENLTIQFENVFRTSQAEKGQIAIIKGGEIAGGYAYNCNENDKFDVYAISKTVLGIIAAKMDQEGVVDLDQTIDAYWRPLANLDFNSCSAGWNKFRGSEKTLRDEVSENFLQNPATLRHFLTHSSTIRNMSMVHQNPNDHSSEWFGGGIGKTMATAAFMLGHTSSQLFYPISQGAPGTVTEYNKDKDYLTRHHAVAGYTMQAASHVTINEYLRDKIFIPMGLNTTAGFKELNSMYYAIGYESSANDLASIIALVANDGNYNGVQILNSNAISELEKVEVGLGNQTIAFNHNNGKLERNGIMSNRDGNFGKYGMNQTGWNSYVSYDPNTGDGFVVTAYGKNCNSQVIYDAARNYTYAF